MDLTSVGIGGICLFLVLIFLRMPIGIAMALAGFLGIGIIRGFGPALSSIPQITYGTVTSYSLSVIGLYVFMGMLAANGGVSKDAFYALNKWVGHFRGGLAMSTTGACAAFGAVCGDHVATSVTMCQATLPEMRRYKYKDQLSLGCIAAGGNLAFLIPPSMGFVLYGFITQVSIGHLFIAGILPGLLLTLLFWIVIAVECRLDPQLAPMAPKSNWGERFSSLKYIWGIAVVFLVVMGGIYAGVFTPTEAGAVGTFAVLLVGLVNRQLTLRGYLDALWETMKTTAMIYILIIGAMIFGTFMTTSDIPIKLGAFVVSFDVDRYLVLIVVLLGYIVLGTFMDEFGLLLVSLPIVSPVIVTHLGFDPLIFGVLCVITIIIGGISPPVGVILFAIHGTVPEVSLLTLFRGVMPFLIAMLVLLALIVAFPDITLLLPNLMLPYR